VSVNGRVITELGSRVDPLTDIVEVDGVRVSLGDAPAYLMLNKPAGYVTTMSDPQGRPTVAELVPQEPAGLFPVGRLDRSTTGLLLFTTDGTLAHTLLHPRYHVEKTYIAEVEGCPSEAELGDLRRGVILEDGPTAPARARIMRADPPAKVEIAIREGRKRQVRRMFAQIGHPVLTLRRVSFGPLSLGDLAEGQHRHLGAEEVDALRLAAGGEG
jgi:23S rRNA pseudouridine2605 synthase